MVHRRGTTRAIGRITPIGADHRVHHRPERRAAYPVGIAPGADGDLWFTDDGDHARRSGGSPVEGQITEFTTGLNSGSDPVEIVAGPDGNLWFTDDGATRAIGRITPSGQITEFTSRPEPRRPPGRDRGRARRQPVVHRRGHDHGDRADHPVGRRSPSSRSGLNPVQPSRSQIAAGPDGNLWFTDQGTTRAIGRITPSDRSPSFPPV